MTATTLSERIDQMAHAGEPVAEICKTLGVTIGAARVPQKIEDIQMTTRLEAVRTK